MFVSAGLGGAGISGREQLSGSQRRGAGQRAERVRTSHSHEGGQINSVSLYEIGGLHFNKPVQKFCLTFKEECWCLFLVSAVSSEPGTHGAESDPAGADERFRAEEHEPGLLRPAASWGAPHTEVTCRDCVLPQWPALPVQHSDPESSGTRPQPLPAARPHM